MTDQQQTTGCDNRSMCRKTSPTTCQPCR